MRTRQPRQSGMELRLLGMLARLRSHRVRRVHLLIVRLLALELISSSKLGDLPTIVNPTFSFGCLLQSLECAAKVYVDVLILSTCPLVVMLVSSVSVRRAI